MSAAVILPVEIGGQQLRLSFKFGSMRLAEAELGRPITAELAKGEVSLDVLSCLFWAVLQPNHRMTRDASDDLVDQAGFGTIAGWIGEGVSRYFAPGVSEAAAEADAGEPAAAAKPAKK